MKFRHPGFGLDINTSSKDVLDLLEKLKDFYKKIPKTKCLQCPNKSSVEADCCKSFSPPMLLIEFLNILKDLENMEENLWKNIFFNCFESFLNPDYVKPCILLNDILCSVYETRPFSCRMFGLYDRTEWEERLNSVKIETGLKEEDIPFYKQCEGISIKKRQNIKTIKKEVSDIIFKNIHQLDIDLFHKEDKENAYEIVMGSYTYIPFDAHFLLMKIGQEKLEDLALMKIRLRKLKEQDRLQYIKFKKEVDEFLLTLKAEIYK